MNESIALAVPFCASAAAALVAFFLMRNSHFNDDEENHGTCLVIGGGLAGLAACSELRCRDRYVKIILVEPKDYFETIWSSYRSVFDEQTAKQSLFHLAEFCSTYRIDHIRQWVTQLHETKAILSNGESIQFDVALVAVGAETSCQTLGLNCDCLKELYHKSGKEKLMDARRAQMKREGDKLIEARSVVIIGGGIVGCELAGDLAALKAMIHSSRPPEEIQENSDNSSIAVTLIHSGDRLCSRELGMSASRMVQEDLEKAGVRIILQTKANVLDSAETDKDTSHQRKRVHLNRTNEIIEADEVVMSVGVKTANSFIKEKSWLDENGWIKVDDSFQVQTKTMKVGRIFAVGDCCTLLPNSGSQILHNSNVYAKNLYLVLRYHQQLKKKSSSSESSRTRAPVPPKLLKYHLLPEIYVVTTGFTSGVADISGFATRWILPLVKNLTMFIFRPRTVIGIKNEYGWIFRPSSVTKADKKPPKKSPQEAQLCLGAAEKVYCAAKDIWVLGKGFGVLSPFLGIAENIAAHVVETSGSSFEVVDSVLTGKLHDLDNNILGPAVNLVVGTLMEAVTKTEEFFKPIIVSLLAPIDFMIEKQKT